MRLPLNCSVDYYFDFLGAKEAEKLYRNLINEYHIDKSRLVIEAGGKYFKTDSFKIVFLTDNLMKNISEPENIYGKTYAWSGLMAELRERIEVMLNKKFEIGMCLFYPDGNYFAPYHHDQKTSGVKTILPSISLGEKREFCFKENESGEVYSMDLENGSLLLMGEYCQDRYTHSLLKNSRYKNGRINITFREAGFK